MSEAKAEATQTLDPQGLAPLLDFARQLDLTRPAEAEAQLEARFPLDSPYMQELSTALSRAIEEEDLCRKGNEQLSFGRLSKPLPETHGFSIDVVNMAVPGPEHVHPKGEIDLCLAVEGEPRFDGREPGWVVYGPGSQHVPTVTNGRMHILYLLPEGAFQML